MLASSILTRYKLWLTSLFLPVFEKYLRDDHFRRNEL